LVSAGVLLYSLFFELVVLKQPQKGTSDHFYGRLVDFEQIVGIVPSNGATISEYGHAFAGDEREEQLLLPDAIADRITNFYCQTRARPPEGRPGYSCHTFVYFALGRVSTIGLFKTFTAFSSRMPENPDNLETGTAYVTRTADGIFNHSLLGIHRPAFSLSTPGDGMPLRIFENRDMLSLYGATDLVSYTPGRMDLPPRQSIFR
jgi:hypothetical protein